jgi:hypothetical protein
VRREVVLLPGIAFICIVLSTELLIFAPLLLGIPHIAYGLGTLFGVDALGRGRKTLGTIAVLLFMGGFFFPAEVILRSGFLLPFIGFFFGPSLVSLLICAGSLGLLSISFFYPADVSVLVLYGHNLVALLVWFFLRNPEKDLFSDFLSVLLISVGFVLLFSRHPETSALVFLQLTHYLFWIFLLPVNKIPGQSMSWIAGVCLLIYGLFFYSEAQNLKDSYLRIAQFHVYLELGSLTFLVSHRRNVVTAA